MTKQATNKIQKPDPRIDYPGVRVYIDYGKFYHFIPVAGTRRCEKLHRILWIEKYGPIPKGMVLVCKSEDTMNVDADNWQLVSKKELCNSIRKYVHNMKSSVEKTCSKCGETFDTIDSKRKICDKCNNPDKGERNVTCVECGSVFTTMIYHKKTCSPECAKKRQYRQTNESHARKMGRIIKTNHKPGPKKKKNVEHVLVGNMRELNRNSPTNDKNIIERKGIESPDLSKIEYRAYDKKMKITRFFKTKERYDEFMAGVNE